MADSANGDQTDTKADSKPTISAPDQAEYEAKKAELEKTLAEASAKLEEVQAELDAKDEKTQDIGAAKAEMVKKLRACQLQKNELHSTQSTSRLRKSELDRERMEIRGKIQSTRANLRYTDLKSLDKKIKDLGGNSDSKQELDILKSQRTRVANLEKYRKEEAKIEKEAEELKSTIDAKGREAQKLRKEESRLMDKVTALERNADSKSARSLNNARRRAQDKKSKTARALANLTRNFEKAKKSFEKAEKRRLKREARELNPTVTDKKPVVQKEEEEVPQVRQRDPYAEQKKAVVLLTNYLRNLLPPEHKAAEEKKVAEQRTQLNTNFQGKTALKKVTKKADADEDFFYGGNRKKKKKRRQRKAKKLPKMILSHPRIPTQNFAKIEITAPLYAEDVLKTLRLVEEKGKFYETAPAPEPAAAKSDAKAVAKKETAKQKHQHELEDFQKEAASIRSAKLGGEADAEADAEADEAPDEPADEPADEPVDEPVDEPADEPADVPADEPVEMMSEEEQKSDYRTYDNDSCMGKSAPGLARVAYISDNTKYPPVQGGEVTLLMFWGQFSKSGFRFHPIYSDLNEEFKKLKVLFLSVDAELGHAKKFLSDPKGKYATIFKTEFAVAYDAKRAVHAKFSALLQKSIVPCHAFLIDASGKIVWHQDHSQIGATAPTFLNAMRGAIKATLAGKAVPSVGAKEGADDDSDEESDEEMMMGV